MKSKDIMSWICLYFSSRRLTVLQNYEEKIRQLSGGYVWFPNGHLNPDITEFM